jgi:hypothetical protein
MKEFIKIGNQLINIQKLVDAIIRNVKTNENMSDAEVVASAQNVAYLYTQMYSGSNKMTLFKKKLAAINEIETVNSYTPSFNNF